MQCVAACCSVLRYVAVYIECDPCRVNGVTLCIMQCVAAYCSVLQRVAACCSIWHWDPCRVNGVTLCITQCVAACCSVLQRVALYGIGTLVV